MAEQKELELIALDFIASMTYQTKLNVMCLENKVMKLPAGSLKDAVFYFVENQKTWLKKLMVGLDKIGLKETMQRDLSSGDLDHYNIICEFARQTHDMPGAADLMEHISLCKEIPGWLIPQIVKLLEPFKN